MGVDARSRGLTTYELLLGEAELADVALATEVTDLWIAPATTDLSSADIELVGNERRSVLLREKLKDAIGRYNYVLIDCPPSLSLLTVNAMVAAHSVLVPLQSEFFALEGLSQLLLTVRQVRQSANPSCESKVLC